LKTENLSLRDVNGFLWTKKRIHDCINCSQEDLVHTLFNLIEITDKLEFELTEGKDENFE